TALRRAPASRKGEGGQRPDKAGYQQADKKGGQGRTRPDKNGQERRTRPGQGRTREADWPESPNGIALRRRNPKEVRPCPALSGLVRLSCPFLSGLVRPCPPFLSVFVRPCPALSALQDRQRIGLRGQRVEIL